VKPRIEFSGVPQVFMLLLQEVVLGRWPSAPRSRAATSSAFRVAELVRPDERIVERPISSRDRSVMTRSLPGAQTLRVFGGRRHPAGAARREQGNACHTRSSPTPGPEEWRVDPRLRPVDCWRRLSIPFSFMRPHAVDLPAQQVHGTLALLIASGRPDLPFGASRDCGSCALKLSDHHGRQTYCLPVPEGVAGWASRPS